MTSLRFLLLHGWSLSGAAMAPLAAELTAAGARVDCPDLPGHGAAEYPASFAGATAMLDDLMSDGLPRVLIGWSMGALIGWRWLAAHPRAPVRAMVSLDMSPRPLPAPGWHFAMGPQAAPLLSRAARYRSHWQETAPAIARGIFAPGREALAEDLLPIIRRHDGAVMAALWEEILAQDLRDEIARIPQTQLFIHGAQSQVCPPGCANWLAKKALSGQGLILPGTGHAPHIEAPKATARAILTALEALSLQ